MIDIKNLRLSYPSGFKLLINNLFVKQGDILAVIGPNGAGKSTLLNIIALFEKPSGGSIEVCAEDILKIKNKTDFRRKLSFVFSQPYLLNDTVCANVSLPLSLRRLKDEAKVSDTLSRFKIADLAKRKTASLSQGQKQRVALARAFISSPKIILLDEPFSSLDPGYKEGLISDLRRMVKAQKVTAIFVTQDQAEALSLADRIALIWQGEVLQESNPEDIFMRPASLQAADFVGVENILEGVVFKKEDNLCFVKVKDKTLEVVSPYNVGDSVFVCLSPQAVTISADMPHNSARNHFKAKIMHIEPFRLEYKINLDCGFNLSSFITKQSLIDMHLAAGSEIFIYFKATSAHLIKKW